MRHPSPPPRLSVRTGAALLAVAAALFGLLAAGLMQHGPLTQADAGIAGWFHDHTRPVFTQLLLAITRLHSTTGVCLMALAGAVFLLWRSEAQWLPVLALSVPGGLMLNALVKHAFQRARPVFADPLLTLPTYSFPSGHTAGATVWWAFFVVLVFAYRPALAWRAAAAALAVVMVALTALSRVYLGVHYPSDVLAAIAEGCGWQALCFTAMGHLQAGEHAATAERHG
jgi:membrane-associated phospholipid phosphatase